MYLKIKYILGIVRRIFIHRCLLVVGSVPQERFKCNMEKDTSSVLHSAMSVIMYRGAFQNKLHTKSCRKL